MEVVFWTCIGLSFYAYIGYGILLFFIVKIKHLFYRSTLPYSQDFKPTVTFVVPSYNEEDIIEDKITNCLNQDYPSEKITFIFITDGSTDNTPEIVRKYPTIQLLHQSARGGKTAAENRAMEFVTSEIVIFSDANTHLPTNAVSHLVKHYENPRVGAVSGEKRIQAKTVDMAAGAGEGIYWKYESLLKKLDAELLTIVGAAGELFSFRRELFKPIETDTILDDFVLSMRIAQRGFRVMYEPQAFALETSSASMKDELKRKIRICAGGWQAMLRLSDILIPWRHPLLTFQYVSHRVLRWSIVPIVMIVAFLLNIPLAFKSIFYFYILNLQLVFYVTALIGWLLQNQNIKLKIFFIPYYFISMNYAVIAGFFRFIKGNQSAAWERSARAKA